MGRGLGLELGLVNFPGIVSFPASDVLQDGRLKL